MIIGIRDAALDIRQCVRGPSIVSKSTLRFYPIYIAAVIITKIFNGIWNILRFCNYHSNRWISNVLQHYLKFIQYCNIKKRKILDILW